MAIAEMSLMTLLGLTSERDALLNALQRTGAAQLCPSDTQLDAAPVAPPVSDTDRESERVHRALAFLSGVVADAPKEKRQAVGPESFGVTVEEFYAVAERVEAIHAHLDRAEQLAQQQANIKAEIARYTAERKGYEVYQALPAPFATYADTVSTVVYLGIVPAEKALLLQKGLDDTPQCVYADYGAVSSGEVMAIVAHQARRAAVADLLSLCAWQACPYHEAETAAQAVARCDDALDGLEKQRQAITDAVCEDAEAIRDLRVYADYLGFVQEKEQAEAAMLSTDTTLLMQAYVPTEAVERVTQAVQAATTACFVQVQPIPRDQYAPTLMRNNNVVNNFEAITNMYSAPAYGALDPNPVMSFFFSLFMGIIMADVCYGLIMILGGFFVAHTRRKGTALYRMARVFAFGGMFALLFGALFDSWFGFTILRNHLGAGYNQFYTTFLDPITASSTVMGITIPSILLWCLLLGTLQIAVSLVCKAVQHFRRHQVVDGIFGGLFWAVGLTAFVVWVYCLARGHAEVGRIAMYITLGGLGVGVLTAGITAKGLGKVTKIGGAAYGLINYMSDILSYARLYGLMLSGAQIASIFTNTLALNMLFKKGPVGIIFGVVIIVVGNLFNIAISLLGAYIHDSRLQYVEFFGRFFEGEGELFTPIGSTHEYVYFVSNQVQKQ